MAKANRRTSASRRDEPWIFRTYAGYDPYLTTIAIAAGLLTTVVTVSAVAKR